MDEGEDEGGGERLVEGDVLQDGGAEDLELPPDDGAAM